MDNHQKIRELIPWYVNGTLSELELDAMNVHIQTCAECRREIECEIRLAPFFRVQPQQLEQLENKREEISDQLFRNIDASIAKSQPPMREPVVEPVVVPLKNRAQSPNHKASRQHKTALKPQNKWIWALVAATVFGVGVPSFLLGRYTQEAPYVALTTPSSYSGGVVQVVFDADVSDAEIARVIAESQAHSLSQPSPNRVYRLAPAPGTDAEELSRQLRRTPAIQWVGVEQQ